MAGTYDNEQQRIADRIKCIAFREARDAGAAFITRQWIADKIHRLTRFATQWWEKAYDKCFADYSECGRNLKLSQDSQNIILNASGKQKKKPLKTETNISDRLWLCDWLKNWTQEDFLHLAPADEFYVWSVRKPNYQNDRIWAKSIKDIEEHERYREMVKNQACIGIFILFTAKKLLSVIKDKGVPWTDQYFRDTILVQHVFPFLKNEENVIDVDEVTFVHDKAPCMTANMTQQLIQDNNINFWGNNRWPGNSPDLNAAERIGSILKDEVETRMLSEDKHDRYREETLKNHICDVLESMETDTELFENLLCSYPSRLEAIKKANGWHTDY
ncbi:unnamed protein product [Adineta ricciae]|uniref:Uncharacterized protein n=1 Tax=Adineta ricciae TaxID=249248 RepID=A0A815DXV9_ADIRI|nr:unnamed protein product [Adineta ricciae]CAF1364156.1 unnamed protein product [Adineta ricciae]